MEVAAEEALELQTAFEMRSAVAEVGKAQVVVEELLVESRQCLNSVSGEAWVEVFANLQQEGSLDVEAMILWFAGSVEGL